MKIRQLELFRYIVQFGTLTRAAEAMSLTQPAASKLLSQFERELGLNLFERTKRRLLLTREGEVFLAELERTWEGFERLQRTARDIKHLKFGRLNIAAMPSVAGSLLPPVVTAFSRKRQNVSISFHARTTERIIEWAIAGQLDIGFTHRGVVHPLIASHLLARIPEVCILPQGHKLADRDTIYPQDLDDETFVRIGDLGDRTEIDQLFLNAGVTRKLNLETPMALVACDLVANGGGVSLVDELTANSYRRSGLIVRRFLPRVFSEMWYLRPLMLRSSGIADAFLADVSAEVGKLGYM